MLPATTRSLLHILGFFLLTLLSFHAGYSQEVAANFPSRPITYVNPIAPNNSTDTAVRLLSKQAEKFLKQTIEVVNKVGGSTTIGTGYLAAAKPDGYTIGYVAHSGFYVVPLLQKVSYHPLRDLTPILQWAGLNVGIAVKGDGPFKSFKDIVEYARNNPKKVAYGTDGPTSMQHIIVQQIGFREKVEFIHKPYEGPAALDAAVLKGEITFEVGISTASAIESGQIRFLVMLKDEPSAEYPSVPILKDLGYTIPCPMGVNIFAPKDIDPTIAQKLEDAFTKAMKEPEFISGMKEMRVPIVYRNSKELDAYMRRSFNEYAQFLKEMGLVK